MQLPDQPLLMSSKDNQLFKFLRIALIYFVLAWGVVKLVSWSARYLALSPWVINWVEVSAFTVFPIIFLILWLANRQKTQHPGKQTVDSITDRRQPRTAGKKKSLAILPFDKTAGKDLNYYATGLAEDMIFAFSSVPGLTVVSRNAATGNRKVTDLHEIMQRVSLKNVLEGEVIKEGERPHIRVSLKNAVNNEVRWTKQFDNGAQTVFDIQQVVFNHVLEFLEIPQPPTNPFKHQTKVFKAYDTFLKARFNFNKREEGLPRAKELFEAAIASDKAYAPAYAGLANTYNLLGFYELSTPKNVFPEAKKSATKALKLNEDLAEAHTALAYTQTIFDWDWQSAEKSFKRALHINPGYATANHWYAEYLMAAGRLDEAIIQSRQAQKHDPLDLIISTLLGMSYYFSRKFDESIAEGLKTLNMAPDYLPVYLWLGMAYEQSGQYMKSIDILVKGKNLTSGTDTKISSLLAHVYARAGRTELAVSELDELNIRAKRQYVSAFNVARINLGLGNKEEALTWLEKGYEERATWLTWINVDPSFDDLRTEPRFQSIINRMNFPQ